MTRTLRYWVALWRWWREMPVIGDYAPNETEVFRWRSARWRESKPVKP